MAEVQQKPDARKAGKPRSKKRSTKIDMTAMVDVAFLLLTFFILTTTMVQQKAMKMVMPTEGGIDIGCSKMMQIYLGAEDKVHWAPGCELSDLRTTDFSSTGIRAAILEKLAANPELIINIKPDKGSRFGNLVDIMDEMNITGAKRYAVSDMTEDERELLTSQGLR